MVNTPQRAGFASSDRIINVVADDREAKSGLIEVLARMSGVKVAIGRLTIGDYAVDHQLLVERKTLSDLVSSIKDGRLFAQAKRLATTNLQSVVLLEGTLHDLKKTGMSREAIQGALITLTVIFGLPLLRSLEVEESARLILYTARQIRRVGQNGISLRGRQSKGKQKKQLTVLQALPGIGPERATRLLDRFGSVKEVLNADTAALQTVDGIGAATAENIFQVVQESAIFYASSPELKDPML